ncbi:hypothetical protein B1H18_05385 [Streptomyces tsukubensis]|uniref:Transposase IS701-like DDE domain-containing protein n=1 Tax=Streptomyces tsukubensis TaxID=83656 RepID=A0A1V4ADP4_9ACTN|nr:hypothetical protein B1H18_05385 [Streptomyces tsukubensis]
MAAVRCDLEDFATEVFEPFARADQRRWGGVCLRGLPLDGGRESVEPMAARLGEDGNRQALVIDDTGFLKDGDASACVSRQYTGTAGKVTNCQARLSLHLASHGASAAVNWRLTQPHPRTRQRSRTTWRERFRLPAPSEIRRTAPKP